MENDVDKIVEFSSTSVTSQNSDKWKLEVRSKLLPTSELGKVDDLTFEGALDATVSKLLFDTPWELEFRMGNRAIEEAPILQQVPMVCKGDQCTYFSVCPIMKGLKESEKKKLLGGLCRVEQMELMKYFGSLAKELNVRPQDAMDLISLGELIRLLVIQRRIQWELNTKGFTQDEPGVMDEERGDVYWINRSRDLNKELERINKQIFAIQKQLASTREQKLQMMKDRDRDKSAGTQFLEKLKRQAQQKDFIDVPVVDAEP